jgi:hypothetical protein
MKLFKKFQKQILTVSIGDYIRGNVGQKSSLIEKKKRKNGLRNAANDLILEINFTHTDDQKILLETLRKIEYNLDKANELIDNYIKSLIKDIEPSVKILTDCIDQIFDLIELSFEKADYLAFFDEEELVRSDFHGYLNLILDPKTLKNKFETISQLNLIRNRLKPIFNAFENYVDEDKKEEMASYQQKIDHAMTILEHGQLRYETDINFLQLFGKDLEKIGFIINDEDIKFRQINSFIIQYFADDLIFRLSLVRKIINDVKVDLQTPAIQSEQAIKETAQPTIVNASQKVEVNIWQLKETLNREIPIIAHSDSKTGNEEKGDMKSEDTPESTTKMEDDSLQKEKNEIIADIKERIENIDSSKGWKYAFKKETDFEYFTQLLADYFIGNLHKDNINLLQKGSVRLQPNCKTKLASVLKEVQKQHGKGKLKKDEGFLNLLRTLDQYNEAPDLFKMISR